MRGEDAPWMGVPKALARTHHSAPFGSWWTNVERDKWGNVVHARWRGPAPEAQTKSTPRLGLGRRRGTVPRPPTRSSR